MNCPRCQAVLSEDAVFCGACGLPIAKSDAQKTQILEPETLKYPRDPLIGQVLDSKYQVVAPLGEGGMGIVYRAHRLHIGDDVAIKVLHQRFVRDRKAAERFRREARSAAAIRHPNVVTIHDFNEAQAEGAPAYIVMELVRGESLRDMLMREGRLSAPRAISLMQQVCAGVGAGHRRGIFHRDLKPDNVIVVASEDDSGETVKVLDFGLAKLRDLSAETALTETGALVGTPSYMPPEQCRGEPLDARSDVYSLGAIFYEMLTGERPFQAPSIAALIAQHLYEAPRPFPPITNVPPALQAVCMRALSKDREARQADATVLSRELQPALTAPRATQTSFDSGPLVEHPQKSHWLRWAIVGLLSVLVFVGVVAIAIRYVSNRTTPANVNSSTGSKAHVITANSNANTETAANMPTESSTSGVKDHDLLGTWSGSYGMINSPATLIVKEQKGTVLSGVLEQGAVRVAFTGQIDEASRKITFKETQVLSGSGWSLGENTGELSADRRTMSGTGQDATGAQLGMSYEWSFTKQ